MENGPFPAAAAVDATDICGEPFAWVNKFPFPAGADSPNTLFHC
jgi:hypothetical protein